MKIAQLVYVGTQSGCGILPDFRLYNIISVEPPCPYLKVNSTVTEQMVRQFGYDTIEIQTHRQL